MLSKYFLHLRHLSLSLLSAMICAVGMMLFPSCADDDDSASSTSQQLTVPDLPDHWTYISLRSGRVLGTCALSDSLALQVWADRTDWDLALCNGLMRTNGGTSGPGQGGLSVSPSPFSAVRPYDLDSLETDCIQSIMVQ